MADKKLFRAASIQAAIARSIYLALASSPSELIVWGLSASDVGLKSWTFAPQTAGDWLPWVQHQNSRCVMAITKVTILFPLPTGVNGIRFGVGGDRASIKAGYSLSQLYGIVPLLKAMREKLTIERVAGIRGNLEGWPVMEGYFTEPVIYDPHDTINVDLACDSTSRIGLVLGGFTVRGMGDYF